MENTGISKSQLVSQLIKIGHKDLTIYQDIGFQTAKQEPELFAHIISWNSKKGEVRDSKVALPIIALKSKGDDELFENAAANLCLLDTRDFLRASRFSKSLPISHDGGSKFLKQAVNLYLREREKNKRWWNKTAIQHRESLKSLYAMYHIKPSDYANDILFKKEYPINSSFAAIKQLKDMNPEEAAGTILNYEIPFLIAVGAIGGIKGKTDLILALIDRMSGNELINNTNMLKKYGVFENQILKAAYDRAVEKMKTSKKNVSTLKAGKAAETLKQTSPKTASKLENIQEQRLEKLGGIEGDWLILGDRSGSMKVSMEVSMHMAALIAQQVKGKVHLVLFNVQPTYFDVTGKFLEPIKDITKRLNATGGTSIGCGLDYISEKGFLVNGIVICSDGGDNTNPYFHEAYSKYIKKFDIEPTVYLLHVPGETDRLSHLCKMNNIQVEFQELGRNVDYYSLPNIIRTLRTNRYSFIDEIMETPLLTFNNVFKINERRVA
jgi:hypothetical protein